MKIWQIKLALALVLVMMVMCASSAFAMLPITEAMTQAKKELIASGKMSNDYLNHTIIDLTYAPSGSVTTYTYTGNNESLTTNNFTVQPQEPLQAAFKITPFVFQLTNQYRPDTEISVSNLTYEQTVHTYTYGARKDSAMYSILAGLVDCLGNPPVHKDSNSGSWSKKYSPEEVAKISITTFKINDPTYTVTSETGESITKTMDVQPVVKDERTFVPVRYLAYALGAIEDDIGWDEQTKTVLLKFDVITEVLTINSQTLLVNDEPVEMDTAPFIENNRTFLPARWIAEPLSAEVNWSAETGEVTITVEHSEQSR